MKQKQNPASDAPEPKPGVEVGDELYVHHGGQPCTGRVAAHGRHGVTVRIGGQHHQVRWDKVLGHKRRGVGSYSVVDQGEDGMIVEDAAGRRRYVATPNEAQEDPLVTKALIPALLLKKAAGAPPRPGLTQKQITDKNGVRTTRWVGTDRRGAPAQRGQHVGFANGEHRGHGEVIASGRHGVTVRDRAGGEHRVRHEQVTHHWDGDGAPDHSPHEQPAAAPEAPVGALFHPDEIASLPRAARQPHDSWDDLVKHGAEGLEQFKSKLGEIGQAMGLVSGKKPDALTPQEWGDDKGYLFVAPLKSFDRASAKVRTDYKTEEKPEGDWSKLRDLVRATISVPTMEHVKQVLQHLKGAGLEPMQKPKDRFTNPTPEGYRDLMLVVKLPNGMCAELQVHVKAMTLAKEAGHEPYAKQAALVRKYKGDEEPTDQWSDEDHDAFYQHRREQQKVYGEAWSKVSGGAGSATNEPMQKAAGCSKMIMLIRGAS